MTETVINDKGMTTHEAAVRYILQRFINDPNFRWYMARTESLHRCVAAEAERRGVSHHDVKKDLKAALNKMGPQRAPTVVQVEKQLDEVREWIDGVKPFGVFQGVTEEDVDKLREIVNG